MHSLENHTRIQTKIGKVYTRFQTKKAQKSHLLGRHTPIWQYLWGDITSSVVNQWPQITTRKHKNPFADKYFLYNDSHMVDENKRISFKAPLNT